MTAKVLTYLEKWQHDRIHVERVIGRLKKSKILNTTIPIAQVDLTENIMVTIAGIIKLNVSVVNK